MDEKQKEKIIEELQNLSDEELEQLQKQVASLINKLNDIKEEKDGE